jgi:predicted regulator of Ras-like GTPase activity (Roadblock/LC7/MglB family)
MPSIRDVVEALHQREGVDAALVVGSDGLAIDSRTRDGVDAEGVAALLPTALRGVADFGAAGGRGPFTAGVLEFSAGLAIVAALTPEATLVILVAPGVNVGSLLFEIQRHRAALAGLF